MPLKMSMIVIMSYACNCCHYYFNTAGNCLDLACLMPAFMLCAFAVKKMTNLSMLPSTFR